MKKILLLILWSIILIITGYIIFLETQKNLKYEVISNTSKHNSWQEEVKETIPPKEEVQETLSGEEIVKQRIEKLRKRLALKWLIIDGDKYFSEGENTLALKKYLAFYKKNPSDTLILEKIADTYTSMHKYTSAKSYYEKWDIQKKEYILSLFGSTNFSLPAEVSNLRQKINSLNISEEEKFYYKTSASCGVDFHECKKEFWEYFLAIQKLQEENEKFENIDGENIQEFQDITYTPLKNIRSAIKNYENFQIDDVTLKNAYILWAWYNDKMYHLSANIWEKELEKRADYKVILKLVAQSFFKTGNYEKSREYLSKYNSIDDSDPAIAYMLGVVNTQLREYVLANIHLSRSIELGFSGSIDARRLLCYNFFLLEDYENMLLHFKKLIQEEDYLEEDFSLAAYNHVLHEESNWVIKNAQKFQEKYPENTDIYAYIGWIQREEEKEEMALNTLLEWEKKSEGKNPFILINIAYTYKQLWNNSSALVYFKKTMKKWKNTEFYTIAESEIQNNKEEDNN